MSQTNQQHVIVIGGSMGGLLTARVLADHFERVTLLERDAVRDLPEVRKGQAHTYHLHGLLASGYQIMQELFPTLRGNLLDGGAIEGDMGAMMRWFAFGGYRRQFQSGLTGLLLSRQFLEWHIRRCVLALPNVTLIDECDAKQLVTTSDHSRVIGVQLIHRAEAYRSETLTADLVVDATGRGSATPKWLETLGYAAPSESRVKCNMAYATRIYRRRAGDLVGAELVMVAGSPPHDRRTGFCFPIEGDRWIVTLGGIAGDVVPTDEAGYLAYAKSLAAPDIHNLISKAEPLTGITPYKYPVSLRRHYEKLRRFPDGYLVMGDAIASFNPVYGQGMSSGALQAQALGRLLQQGGNRPNLWRDFFRQAAAVVDIPWQLAVGEDFRYAETEGPKPAGIDFINRYVTRVHRATHHDPVVYAQFLQVMNLLQPPTTLMQPRIALRLLRGRSAAATPTPVNSVSL